MPTNQYFDNFFTTAEQNLHTDLIVESIKQYGIDMYYLPRSVVAYDKLYAQDPQKEYVSAHLCEFYVRNVEGFAGEGDFLSKFNIQIRDQITFTVARNAFDDNIGTPATLVRPREGDLVFFPLNNKIFEIKFVEHESMFYPLGALQVYDIKCELFEYSGERFETGITEIDSIVSVINSELSNFSLLAENGKMLYTESGFPIIIESFEIEEVDPLADNTIIQNEASDIIDFSEVNPFSEGAI